jgi:hypothetical protein
MTGGVADKVTIYFTYLLLKTVIVIIQNTTMSNKYREEAGNGWMDGWMDDDALCLYSKK